MGFRRPIDPATKYRRDIRRQIERLEMFRQGARFYRINDLGIRLLDAAIRAKERDLAEYEASQTMH